MASPWVTRFGASEYCRVRIFCFPYAGGGASVYRLWATALPSAVEVCAVQLPGRENRLKERPFHDVSLLVEALASELAPYLNKPCVFYGHSIGALVAFELARTLSRMHVYEPAHLFASGFGAPQVSRRDRPIYTLPKEEFLQELQSRYGGIPEAVAKNQELVDLMMPALRGDVALLDTYTYTDGCLLDCPVTALGGTEDHFVYQEDLKSWGDLTNGSFSLLMLPGDHFFLQSSRSDVLAAVSVVLNGLLDGSIQGTQA